MEANQLIRFLTFRKANSLYVTIAVNAEFVQKALFLVLRIQSNIAALSK